MAWKRLFKPTLTKIIMTLALIIIFPLPYWNGNLCEYDFSRPCPNRNFGPAIPGWFATWEAGLDDPDNSFNVLKDILIKLLFIGLPASYLISCAVTGGLDLFRKRLGTLDFNERKS